ncbi:dead deah box DNA helicase [Niveomyces insectorum RCEF 264]|uniref:Dead deah box DNA helicase n=1 Tax=Niveomyces insectorum RCEF 264 TaxID=1081102 RepID=A0A167PHV4_9HYPO|nr:dead deah box DNA helicase [Niveomyces insectorum RCEF 264]
MLVPRPWRLAWRTLSYIVRPSSRRKTTTSAAATNPLPALLLRDYQEDCIRSVLASLDRGQKRVGISLATGAGKTVIFTQLLDRVRPPGPGATQTLILAHRRELVEQAARHCTQAYPGKTVEIEMGALHASGAADVTVASVQSLTSGTRLAKFAASRFKLVLVDEAHHIVAPGYMRALAHFGLDSKAASQRAGAPALVGVSATFSRFDGLALGAAIDEIVYHRDYIDMMGAGWLSHVLFTTVESTADLSRVRSGGGLGKDFQTGDLSRAVNTPAVNEVTVRTWLAKAAAAGRRATLVFCVDVRHVVDLTRAFRAHGVDAQYVTGDTDKAERSARLDAFKQGAFPVLVNCGVFTEGTDLPNVDCVVLARPTKSRNLLVQMIGRGLRLHADKTDCHILDMVSSLDAGIVTTPTLFGLDPGELVSGASVDDMQALRDRRKAEENEDASTRTGNQNHNADNAVAIKSVKFTDYESVFDLIADTSGERHIRALSQHAWVQVGKDRYVLCGPTGTYLRIEGMDAPMGAAAAAADNDAKRSDNPGSVCDDNSTLPADAVARNTKTFDASCRYRVVEVRALPAGLAAKSPYAAPREVCHTEAFVDAVHAADKYASEVFPRPFIHRYQRWRKGPPTHGQLAFLNKLRGTRQEALTDESIDRGTAADMITKIKHGARGRFADLAAHRRRQERVVALQERERVQRQREEVTIGPLPV